MRLSSAASCYKPLALKLSGAVKTAGLSFHFDTMKATFTGQLHQTVKEEIFSKYTKFLGDLTGSL